jgi:hypothetical protein
VTPALYVGGPWDGAVYDMPDQGPDEVHGPNGSIYRRTHLGMYGSRITVYLDTDTIFDAIGGTFTRLMRLLSEPHPNDRVNIGHDAVILELRMRVGRGIAWPDDRRKYTDRQVIAADDWEAVRHAVLARVTTGMADRLLREVTQAGLP